jgi:hypothetical protein
MWTVCTLEAESDKFWGKVWVRGKGTWVKYWARLSCWVSSCYGPFSVVPYFETCEPYIPLIFNFCSGLGKPQTVNHWIRSKTAIFSASFLHVIQWENLFLLLRKVQFFKKIIHTRRTTMRLKTHNRHSSASTSFCNAARQIRYQQTLLLISEAATLISVVVKVIPLQSLTAPDVSRCLKFPDFKTIATWNWQNCQPYAPASFTPVNIPGTHHC